MKNFIFLTMILININPTIQGKSKLIQNALDAGQNNQTEDLTSLQPKTVQNNSQNFQEGVVNPNTHQPFIDQSDEELDNQQPVVNANLFGANQSQDQRSFSTSQPQNQKPSMMSAFKNKLKPQIKEAYDNQLKPQIQEAYDNKFKPQIKDAFKNQLKPQIQEAYDNKFKPQIKDAFKNQLSNTMNSFKDKLKQNINTESNSQRIPIDEESDNSEERDQVSQNLLQDPNFKQKMKNKLQGLSTQSHQEQLLSQSLSNERVNQSSEQDLRLQAQNSDQFEIQERSQSDHDSFIQAKQLTQSELDQLEKDLQKKREQNASQLLYYPDGQPSQNNPRKSWNIGPQQMNTSLKPVVQNVSEIKEPQVQTKPQLKSNLILDTPQDSPLKTRIQSETKQKLIQPGTQLELVPDNRENLSQDKLKSKIQSSVKEQKPEVVYNSKLNLNQPQQKELERMQKYQQQLNEKSKLLKRDHTQALQTDKGNSCNKDLLLAFGLKIDENRKNAQIVPQASGVNEKTLCRRNIGTCCTYNEMMSVADDFAVTANKFREQFILLEELYVMFKGGKMFEVLLDIKQIDKCEAIMKNHVLIPRDENGVAQGTFETTVALEIQNNVAGLFNEMRRYKKHIISNYGNVVCSICSPSESKYFKLNEQKELAEIDITFANCQEFMDLKDFEIRVAEVYQKYLLPLVAVMECNREEDDPKVDELELDEIIEDKNAFDDCFNNYALENPNCQEICREFDIKTYSFPGNFFQVSKQMFRFFFKRFAKGEAEEYYQNYKDKNFDSFANLENFVFFPHLKVPKVEEDIYEAEVKLVESRGINITNDYINRMFLEHNQFTEQKSSLIISALSVLMILFA